MIYQALELTTDFYTTYPGICMLDIETTGLCKQKDAIFLIGLLEQCDHSVLYHFWLCESLDDEKNILRGFLNYLCNSHKLYTYGGTSFDASFIASRCEHYALDLTLFRSLAKLDFKKVPFFKAIFSQHSLKRTHLEALLHFNRHTTTTGRELAKLSLLHLNRPNPTYKNLILSHNKDEVLSLLYCFHFYQLVKNIHPSQHIESSIEGYSCIYTFKCSTDYPYDLSFAFGYYEVAYRSKDNLLTVTLKAQLHRLKHYLPYKDYYLVNGELMHRSLAHFIPSGLKQKATRLTAYIEKEDYYIPVSSMDPIWVDELKNTYIPFSEASSLTSLLIKDLSKKIARGLIN